MAKRKTCVRCKQDMRLNKFYPKGRTPVKGAAGRVSMCKRCCAAVKELPTHKLVQQNSRFKRKYGITSQQRAIMALTQGNQCFICEIHQDYLSGPLVIDHCHKTGKVRRLLCTSCNMKLGVIEDAEFLAKAKQYLEETVSSPTAGTVVNINQGVISTVQSNQSD